MHSGLLPQVRSGRFDRCRLGLWSDGLAGRKRGLFLVKVADDDLARKRNLCGRCCVGGWSKAEPANHCKWLIEIVASLDHKNMFYTVIYEMTHLHISLPDTDIEM